MNSVIIVGGGVIGLLTAYELHQAGQKVTVFDRQACGMESSWAGGGIISPLYPWRYPEPISRLAKWSQAIYPEVIQPMQQVTGIDPQFLPSGMLVLGNYQDENPLDWALTHQINMEWINNKSIQQLAPEVNPTFSEGLWLPDIHQVRNPRLISLIQQYLLTTDVQLIEQKPVEEILFEQDMVTGVRSGNQAYHADQVVIACGAWSSSLIPEGHDNPQIKPIRGQMLLLKGTPGKVRHITLSENRYIIPRKDGHILVGSTTEDVGFDKSTLESVRQSLIDYAETTIPGLAQLNIEHHWSGLRPGVKSGIPSIGEHPQLKNLYINSGHYRNGLVLAPASARLLMQIMLQKPITIENTDYAPCDAHHN